MSVGNYIVSHRLGHPLLRLENLQISDVQVAFDIVALQHGNIHAQAGEQLLRRIVAHFSAGYSWRPP